MWTERFKHKLSKLGLRYKDAAEVMGMTKNGFQSAMDNATFSFDKMIKLADKYNFSLDELRFEENNIKAEESIDNYKRSVKIYHSLRNDNSIPMTIYEDIKLNYENRIKDLQDQIKYMQQLFEMQQNKGGAKSA